MNSLATTDPQAGDEVTKGSRTRTVMEREGKIVRYKTEEGTNKSCWITGWETWCRDADTAVTAGNK